MTTKQQGQYAPDGSQYVTFSDGSGSLGSAYSSSVSVARTSDTNAYTANDVIGGATGSTAAMEFTNIGPSGASVMITGCSLEVDSTALISGEATYRLFLYNVTPPSALGDNAAYDLPSGDRASFLDYIDISTPIDLGSTLFIKMDNLNKQVKLSGTSIFAYLVTIGAFTPASGTVRKVTLHAAA